MESVEISTESSHNLSHLSQSDSPVKRITFFPVRLYGSEIYIFRVCMKWIFKCIGILLKNIGIYLHFFNYEKNTLDLTVWNIKLGRISFRNKSYVCIVHSLHLSSFWSQPFDLKILSLEWNQFQTFPIYRKIKYPFRVGQDGGIVVLKSWIRWNCWISSLNYSLNYKPSNR